MSHAKTLLAALSLMVAVEQAAPAANYLVEPAHTSVIFAVSHLGYSFTYGRFNKVEGKLIYDAQSPEASRFALDIDPASLDTNDEKRDQHLRGADFFNVKQFPKLEFRSTTVKPVADKTLQVTGEFTMHGVTKQITIPLQVLGAGKGPYGKERVGFLTQFSLKRSEFEMTGMVGPIGDEVSVIISFEAVMQ